MRACAVHLGPVPSGYGIPAPACRLRGGSPGQGPRPERFVRQTRSAHRCGAAGPILRNLVSGGWRHCGGGAANSLVSSPRRVLGSMPWVPGPASRRILMRSSTSSSRSETRPGLHSGPGLGLAIVPALRSASRSSLGGGASSRSPYRFSVEVAGHGRTRHRREARLKPSAFRTSVPFRCCSWRTIRLWRKPCNWLWKISGAVVERRVRRGSPGAGQPVGAPMVIADYRLPGDRSGLDTIVGCEPGWERTSRPRSSPATFRRTFRRAETRRSHFLHKPISPRNSATLCTPFARRHAAARSVISPQNGVTDYQGPCPAPAVAPFSRYCSTSFRMALDSNPWARSAVGWRTEDSARPVRPIGPPAAKGPACLPPGPDEAGFPSPAPAEQPAARPSEVPRGGLLPTARKSNRASTARRSASGACPGRSV